jgi:hypothetical protein
MSLTVTQHLTVPPESEGGASLEGTLSKLFEEAYRNRCVFMAVNELLKREGFSPNAASHITHLNR